MNRRDARQSLNEERKAISDYGKRGERSSDPKLKQIFKHAQGEEKEHAKAFKGYLVAKLTTARRKGLSTSTFGLPGSRKYPMPDRSHAGNAKARAAQQYNKGNLSASAKAQIDAKANRILGGSKSVGAIHRAMSKK